MGQPRKRRGRGEGGIVCLAGGSYRATFSAGRAADGSRARLTATFPTKTEALDWLSARRAEHRQGHVAPGRQTCGEWLASWLLSRKDAVEALTWETYERHVRLHLSPRLAALPLAGLRPDHLTRLYGQLAVEGVSAPLRRHVADTLRTALDAALRLHLIPSNPCRVVGHPRKGPRPEIRPLSAAECVRLLAALAGDRLEALYALALDSGMRQGELLGLHWPQVEPNAVRVVQALSGAKERKLKDVKTASSRRRVTLTPQTCRLLEAHREAMRREGRDVNKGPVFVSRRGNFLLRASLSRHFARRLRAAGLEGTRFHDLRHSCATLLLRAGVSVRSVAARLGHSDPAMTLRVYAHHMPEDDARASTTMAGLLFGAIDTRPTHDGLTDGAGI